MLRLPQPQLTLVELSSTGLFLTCDVEPRAEAGAAAHFLTVSKALQRVAASRAELAGMRPPIDLLFGVRLQADTPEPRPCTFPVPSLYLPCTFPVPSQVDSYERPADGRRARTYRFAYRSDRLALSRERAKQMNELVVTALEREYYEPRGVSPAAAAAVEAAAAASGEAEEAAALQDGSGTEGARESKKLRSLRASGRSEACGSRDAHALP